MIGAIISCGGHRFDRTPSRRDLLNYEFDGASMGLPFIPLGIIYQLGNGR